MSDRYIVLVDTDYEQGRAVYDVLDLETNEYFEASWGSAGAHRMARQFNEGVVLRQTYDYAWKKYPHG